MKRRTFLVNAARVAGLGALSGTGALLATAQAGAPSVPVPLPHTLQPGAPVAIAESFGPGHLDKLADLIADAVLDFAITADPWTEGEVDVWFSPGHVVVGGFLENGYIDASDVQRTVHAVLREVSDAGTLFGVEPDRYEVRVTLRRSTHDICRLADPTAWSRGVANSFGYATDETPERLPLAAALAHRLGRRLVALHRAGQLPEFCPPQRAVVAVSPSTEMAAPLASVVLDVPRHPDVRLFDAMDRLVDAVIRPALGDHLHPGTRLFINAPVTADWGLQTGASGRCPAADTYGGQSAWAESRLAGQGPTNGPRLGAYAARYVAHHVVAAGLARRCAVNLVYARGHDEPVTVQVDTQGTGATPDPVIAAVVQEAFDLRVAGLVEQFGLRRPIYRQTAIGGHFGRPEPDFAWERLDGVDALRAALADREEVRHVG